MAKENKILNNKFNTGEIEFEFFGKMKIDDDWKEKYENNHYRSRDYYEDKKLQENLYEIFKNAPFYEKYKKIKKVKKDEILTIFNYFIERIEEPERYGAIDKFLSIATFMNMNFKILYKELSSTYKQQILKEFDEKYDIFKAKKLKRLF